jgi:hypothetical protein
MREFTIDKPDGWNNPIILVKNHIDEIFLAFLFAPNLFRLRGEDIKLFDKQNVLIADIINNDADFTFKVASKGRRKTDNFVVTIDNRMPNVFQLSFGNIFGIFHPSLYRHVSHFASPSRISSPSFSMIISGIASGACDFRFLSA